MVHCFPLHICLRLSAVQKNDKLHQTEPVIGGRFFLIFHFKKVATKVFFLASDTLCWQKKGQKILSENELKESVMIIMNLQNPLR